MSTPCPLACCRYAPYTVTKVARALAVLDYATPRAVRGLLAVMQVGKRAANGGPLTTKGWGWLEWQPSGPG